MHFVIFLLLAGACLAHYRGEYETLNLIEREEPAELTGVLVECPVCESRDNVLPSVEKCDIFKDGKRYKRCSRGTYKNEVCGNREDCYRGPGERCTEKMSFDIYGEKCARGLSCIGGVSHRCSGLNFDLDRNIVLWLNNPYLYPLPHQHKDQASKFESALIMV